MTTLVCRNLGLAYGWLITPTRFHPMSHVSKYNVEIDPNHWLKDYWLTMSARGADDNIMVQYLPLLIMLGEGVAQTA